MDQEYIVPLEALKGVLPPALLSRGGGLAITSDGLSAAQSNVRYAPGPMAVELKRMMDDLQVAFDAAPARLHAHREQFRLGLTLCRTAVQVVGGGG